MCHYVPYPRFHPRFNVIIISSKFQSPYSTLLTYNMYFFKHSKRVRIPIFLDQMLLSPFDPLALIKCKLYMFDLLLTYNTCIRSIKKTLDKGEIKLIFGDILHLYLDHFWRWLKEFYQTKLNSYPQKFLPEPILFEKYP